MRSRYNTVLIFFAFALSVSQFSAVQVFAAEAPLKVTITDLKGTAEILKLGASQGTPALKGTELLPSDELKVGQASSAKIEIESVGTLELDAETSWSFVRSVTDEEKRAFEAKLAIGRLRAKIKKLPDGSRFEIKTPTSIVGVRGTSFSLFVYLVQSQLFALVEVFDGSVDYSNLRGDKVIVSQGQSATADESGKLSEGKASAKKEEEQNKKEDGNPPGGGSSGGDEKDPFEGYPPGVDNFMGRAAPQSPQEPIAYSNPAQQGESHVDSSSSSSSSEDHHEH